MTFKDESNDKIEHAKIRENIKLSYKLMTKAIDEVHDSTKPYNYSNEANMIYRIVLGVDTKHFRESRGLKKSVDILDTLTNEQLQAIDRLQLENKKFLYDGMKYQERKEKLTYIYNYLAHSNMSNDFNFSEIEESDND